MSYLSLGQMDDFISAVGKAKKGPGDDGIIDSFAQMMQDILGTQEAAFIQRCFERGSDQQIMLSSFRSIQGCDTAEHAYAGLHVLVRRLRRSDGQRQDNLRLAAAFAKKLKEKTLAVYEAQAMSAAAN